MHTPTVEHAVTLPVRPFDDDEINVLYPHAPEAAGFEFIPDPYVDWAHTTSSPPMLGDMQRSFSRLEIPIHVGIDEPKLSV